MMQEHLKKLGFRVTDIVTGFSGVVTSVSFDLYGCVQCIVTPEAVEGKVGDSCWFDDKRLQVMSEQPVMPVPTFATTAPPAVIGAQAKPAQPMMPTR